MTGMYIKLVNSGGTVYYFVVANLGRVTGNATNPASVIIVAGGQQLSGINPTDWNAARLLNASFVDVGANPFQI
jgi:hypothetical protein